MGSSESCGEDGSFEKVSNFECSKSVQQSEALEMGETLVSQVPLSFSLPDSFEKGLNAKSLSLGTNAKDKRYGHISFVPIKCIVGLVTGKGGNKFVDFSISRERNTDSISERGTNLRKKVSPF